MVAALARAMAASGLSADLLYVSRLLFRPSSLLTIPPQSIDPYLRPDDPQFTFLLDPTPDSLIPFEQTHPASPEPHSRLRRRRTAHS